MSFQPRGESPKASTALEPLHIGVATFDAEVVAQESLQEGVEQGYVSSDLVQFAKDLVPETGREVALILPLQTLLSRHSILAAAHDDMTRSEKVYGFYTSDRATDTDRLEWTWRKSPGLGNSYRYTSPSPQASDLEINSPFLVATSPEDLEAMITWRKNQAARRKALEEESPLGDAAALVEAAYGGIDITNPPRAIHEFSARLLTAAVIMKQHGSTISSFGMNSDLIEPRLKLLFGNINDKHSKSYSEFIEKISSAATMMTVDGNIEAARMQVLVEMVSADTTRFLEGVWPDLERVVALERLGRGRMGALIKIMQR